VLDRNATGSAAADAIADWRRVLRVVMAVMSRTCGCDDILIVKEWPPTSHLESKFVTL